MLRALLALPALTVPLALQVVQVLSARVALRAPPALMGIRERQEPKALRDLLDPPAALPALRVIQALPAVLQALQAIQAIRAVLRGLQGLSDLRVARDQPVIQDSPALQARLVQRVIRGLPVNRVTVQHPRALYRQTASRSLWTSATVSRLKCLCLTPSTWR